MRGRRTRPLAPPRRRGVAPPALATLLFLALVARASPASDAAVAPGAVARASARAPPPSSPPLANPNAGARRFATEDESRFSPRLLAMLTRPCEAYARNVLDEPARHLQHAAVIFLRHACRKAPPRPRGETPPACADLANAVAVDLDHAEASALLRQLLHERCQAEAVILTERESRSRSAADFLIHDTVRRVAEEEQEIRDHAGATKTRAEVEAREAEDAANDDEDEDPRGEYPADSRCDAATSLGGDGSESESESESCPARGSPSPDASTDPRPTPNAAPAFSGAWGWSGPDASDAAFARAVADRSPESEETARVERMVLVELHRATDGARWRRRRGWLEPGTHCAWEGVTCHAPSDRAGVLSLDLPANGLAGTLPQTLARLRRLRHLDARANDLRGTLSPAFGAMPRIESLRLGSNAIYGKIPGELGAAVTLAQLDLSDNAFAGALPPELARLERLRFLNVSANGLSGELPRGVAALPDLEIVSLARNRMRGDLAIPASALGPNVRLFDASDNAFGGPPAGPPRRATRVGVWDVSGNALEGPAPFGPGNAVPASLRVLGMARMRGVTGTLPEETFRPDPEEGEVRRGEVRSGPNENPSVGVATREAAASAGSESLRGGHPPSELRRVDLSGCSLSGSLPRSLMALSHARVVNVSDNAFTGAIPSEGDVDARRMARLQAFDASNNLLEGTLPPSLAGLATLRHLDLSRNRLTGTLPGQQLGDLTSLRTLDLRENAFGGVLPPELGALTRLTRLDVSRNRLEGPVPVDLITGASLAHLDVSGNELDWTTLGARPVEGRGGEREGGGE